MRKTIEPRGARSPWFLGALLAVSLVGLAGAEVTRDGPDTFKPGTARANQLKDIPAAHNLGSGQQAEKVAVSLQGSLPAYLEKQNLDTAVHRASDFQPAGRGNAVASKISPQAALAGGGKKAVSSNKLNPIDL